jgi:hypothetical protein
LGSVIEPEIVAVIVKLVALTDSRYEARIDEVMRRFPLAPKVLAHIDVRTTAAAVAILATRRPIASNPTGQSRVIMVPSARR